MWTLTLNGVDITEKVGGVTVTFAAENICGEITVELADRSVLDGIIVPRVPREPLISYRHSPDHPVVWFYLEDIQQPQDLNSRTATVWGRSASARLTAPWAQKISKQWSGGETIDSIIQEVAALCGVTVTVQNDFPVCQYCYAVSDQTPAEIIRDLATRSGQIIWPQVDGSILVAPRAYTYGTPDVVLDAAEIVVESLDRQVPDFGNRILVSGDASVAGLSVTVVPLADEDACVVADGKSAVRLIAIVLGADGLPVALGTVVTWSASSGYLSAQTSATANVVRQGEVHQADSYLRVTLDLPAVSVVGVYARKDTRRVTNLYRQRGGSVSGRVITFAAPLDFYDQALVIDYIVAGAPITWTAGWIPGDVTVLGSVAGAQGYVTLHQSNPTACATQLSLEAIPSSPCLGEAVTIFLKTLMFGAEGVGAATFGIVGCGTLSSTRKTLQPRQITETLRTSTWGGAAEVRLSAVPVSGTPVVHAVGTTSPNLYASRDGQTVILNDPTILPGTQVTVTYIAGGTAMVSWLPSALPSGSESITETLLVTHSGTGEDVVAQVTLSRTPVAAPSCIPLMELSSFYASHAGKVVTLLEDGGVILPVGTQVVCSYQSIWGTQPGCSATITVRVEDGSEDGGFGQLSVSARDCRTVNPGSTDPDEIPDETIPDEDGEDDPIDPPDLDDPEDEEIDATSCAPEAINGRTPTITAKNHDQVFAADCSSPCTCDQLCAALRSTGRLSTEGNMTWATCMEACSDARAAKCTQCTLAGPTYLNPGEAGVWTDNKGNTGEWKGELGIVSRTAEGYTARMPSGGGGPFLVKVCYGATEDTCCEAHVAFPPCTLAGPTQLEAGTEGTYVPSLGMVGATVVCSGGMEFVRNLAYDVGFVAKMKEGECTGGTVTVSYGGRVCGTINVTNPKTNYGGVVSGDPTLARGETATYYHDLGQGATYTGTLPVIGTISGPDGNGVICMMPANASYESPYVVSFNGQCGSSASMVVTGLYDVNGHCLAPWGGCGEAQIGSIVSYPESHIQGCYRVLDDCFNNYGCNTMDDVNCASTPRWRVMSSVNRVWTYRHSLGFCWSCGLEEIE